MQRTITFNGLVLAIATLVSGVFVAGSLVVYQIGPYERKTANGMVEEPLQLRAVNLKNGEIVWSQPIRDTVERAAPPP
jgi:hypothetical protein